MERTTQNRNTIGLSYQSLHPSHALQQRYIRETKNKKKQQSGELYLSFHGVSKTPIYSLMIQFREETLVWQTLSIFYWLGRCDVSSSSMILNTYV
jgi:hypothetical protein